MNVICRRAEASVRDALTALWMEAFSDSLEDVTTFLETLAYTRHALVLCEDNRVCSMLFLLPTAVQDGQRRFTVGYIYAGATHTDARGKGYYRRLLAYAEQIAKQEGMVALMLRPASEILFATYRRMGFTVPLYGSVDRTAPIQTEEVLDAHRYAVYRRQLLDGQAFVDWDDRVWSLALSWCEAVTDGSCLILRDDQNVWECLPAEVQTETALLMPLTDDFQTTAPVWFGYGLE